MRFPGFVGPTYTSLSSHINCERAINLFAEQVEDGNGKNTVVYFGTPGLVPFAALPDAPVRAMLTLNGRMWALAGATFYEVFSGGGYAPRGTITVGPTVSLATNGNQICIVTANNGWIYDLSANTVAAITAPGFSQFGGAVQVVCIDGYFICFAPSSRKFFISAYLDGTTWSALQFQSAEGTPTNLVGIAASHRLLWCFGGDRVETYYNSGDPNLVFSRDQNSLINKGCAAAFSVAQMNESLYWLGADQNGAGIVYRAQGYATERISTHAVEAAIARYSKISDAQAFCYQDGGHQFYVLHFPTPSATWVYDATTGWWHERAYFNNGTLQAHLGRTHVYAFGLHLVGDYLSGNIYRMSLDAFSDNGAPIKRVRRAPHLTNEQRWTFYKQLAIDMEVGVGLDGGAADPVAVLRFSNDGGKTWSAEQSVSLGALGKYKQRVIFRRLGKARDRVFELTITDSVRVAISGAYLDWA